MGFLDLVRRRYSVRRYADRSVPREAIDHCMEAARLAPSACNSQPWKFVVVDDADKRKVIAQAAVLKGSGLNRFVVEAPVLVCIVSQRQKLSAKLAGIVKRKDYSLMDIGIAAEHFCLQATEEGLGTCMLGWFNERKVKQILSIPKGRRVELIITLGYAVDKISPEKNRKDIDEMLSYNDY